MEIQDNDRHMKFFEYHYKNGLLNFEKKNDHRDYVINVLSIEIERSADREKVCNKFVCCALNYLKYQKQECGEVYREKHSVILPVAASLCYKWDLSNSSTVASVLDAINDCRALNSFIVCLISNSPYTRYANRADRWWPFSQTRTPCILQYFLWHSSLQRQTLSFKRGLIFMPPRILDLEPRDKRLSDVVMLVFFRHYRFASIASVFTALRFASGNIPISKVAISVALNHIGYVHRRVVQVANPNVNGAADGAVNENDVELAEYLKCLHYFYRTIPHLQVKHVKSPYRGLDVDIVDQDGRIVLFYPEENPKWLTDRILPLNRYRNPAALMHLCRCAIRKRLGENWELPFGIDKLEIPELLKDYLNLMF